MLNIDAECSCVEPTTLLNIYILRVSRTLLSACSGLQYSVERSVRADEMGENSVAPPDVALTRGGLMVAVEQGRVYLR